MNRTEWETLLGEIGTRWPRMDPMTSIERADWRSAIEHQAIDDVRDGLRRVKALYASDTPRLPWVLAALREIHAEREAAKPRTSATDAARDRAEAQVMLDRRDAEVLVQSMSDDEIEAARARVLAAMPRDREAEVDFLHSGHVCEFAWRMLRDMRRGLRTGDARKSTTLKLMLLADRRGEVQQWAYDECRS